MRKIVETLEWEAIVKDKDGKIIARRKGKGDSYLKNYMVLHFALIGLGGENAVDTGGNTVTINKADCSDVHVDAGEGVDEYGIVVGTGTDDNLPGMYNLQSPIEHGDGDNLLHYYGHSLSAPTVSGSDVLYEISRDFKNNGSVDITVYEAGLIVKIGTATYVLIGRQVISGGIAVPAGATLTFKFKPKITVT